MGLETETPFVQLRQYIAERRMAAGDRLPSIRELAHRFDIGVVAARDALVQAEREGLVEIRPRSGAYLAANFRGSAGSTASSSADLRVVDGRQLYVSQARRLIESDLIARAVLRCRPEDLLPIRQTLERWVQARRADDMPVWSAADSRLHISVAEIAGNPVLTGMLQDCLRQQLMDECTLAEDENDREIVIAIHVEIYESLRSGDPDRARRSIAAHMDQLEQNIHFLLQSPPTAAASPAAAVPLAKKPRRSRT